MERTRCRRAGSGTLVEDDRLFDLALARLKRDRDCVARFVGEETFGERAVLINLVTVDREDDVAFPQPGVIRGATSHDLIDVRPLINRQIVCSGADDIQANRRHREVGIDHVPGVGQLLDDPLNGVRRDRKEETLHRSALVVNWDAEGVDTNDLPVDIEQWSTRVAGVDRGVVLNHVDVDLRTATLEREVTIRGAYNPLGDSVSERSHWSPDCQDGLPRTKLVRVGETQRGGRISRNLNNGQVADLVAADQRGVAGCSAREDHHELVGSDDVPARHDVSIVIDDEAGTRTSGLHIVDSAFHDTAG
jgi:hypothetical protein